MLLLRLGGGVGIVLLLRLGGGVGIVLLLRLGGGIGVEADAHVTSLVVLGAYPVCSTSPPLRGALPSVPRA